MPPEHRNIQKWIKKMYSGRFRVLAETIDDFKAKVELIRNRLPHLSSIRVVTKEDFEQGLLRITSG